MPGQPISASADAGSADAGSADAGSADAGSADAGSADAGADDVTGKVGREDLAVLHDGDTVHDGPVDPPGPGRVAGFATGEIADLLLRLELDRLGIEDEGVGVVAGQEHP